MKKFFAILCVLLVGLGASADEVIEIQTNVNMENFWKKTGLPQEKVLGVGEKIINANKMDKHIAIYVLRNLNTVNAYATYSDKAVHVYTGILPYFDNDDELAYVIAHEMGHCLDFYKGPMSVATYLFNQKAFEKRADLTGIDLMAQAGYDPVAAIIVQKKISGEHAWDTWIFFSHPKASNRMMDMYKYIYKKYPESLNSDMTQNINYQNFVYSSQKEINAFQQKEKFRQLKNKENL
jgi:predicted Zn-dependent protease